MGLTVQVKLVEPVAPVESFAVTVTDELPWAVGVPEITPVPALIDRPAGRPLAVQVYGAVPPVALSCTLTGLPTVPDWLPGLLTLTGLGPGRRYRV